MRCWCEDGHERASKSCPVQESVAADGQWHDRLARPEIALACPKWVHLQRLDHSQSSPQQVEPEGTAPVGLLR